MGSCTGGPNIVCDARMICVGPGDTRYNKKCVFRKGLGQECGEDAFSFAKLDLD